MTTGTLILAKDWYHGDDPGNVPFLILFEPWVPKRELSNEFAN